MKSNKTENEPGGATRQHHSRSSGRGFLEAADDIQVIGEAMNGHPSVREAKRLQPDVALLDRAMPLSNGQTEVLQLLAESHANKQIAEILSISIITVEKCRQTHPS